MSITLLIFSIIAFPIVWFVFSMLFSLAPYKELSDEQRDAIALMFTVGLFLFVIFLSAETFI